MAVLSSRGACQTKTALSCLGYFNWPWNTYGIFAMHIPACLHTTKRALLQQKGGHDTMHGMRAVSSVLHCLHTHLFCEI